MVSQIMRKLMTYNGARPRLKHVQALTTRAENLSREEAVRVLTEVGKNKAQIDDYLNNNDKHVKAVMSSYFQIGTLKYTPELAKEILEIEPNNRKGFLKLFNDETDPERISSNIAFLKELSMTVPSSIMVPAIICHDIGREGPRDPEHPQKSADIFGRIELRERFGLDFNTPEGITNIRLIENAIRYHLFTGGFVFGEFSIGYLHKYFERVDFSDPSTSKSLELYIDSLTLLTSCDIAGYFRNYTPINYKLEDLAYMNRLLKTVVQKTLNMTTKIKIGEGSRDIDGESKKFMRKELNIMSVKQGKSRLARFMLCDDHNMDGHTNKGLSLLIKELDDSLLRANISASDEVILWDFFGLVDDFFYSAFLQSYLLWGRDMKEGGIKFGQDKVNENILKFYVHVAKTAGIKDGLPMKFRFAKEGVSNFGNISELWPGLVSLQKAIAEGNFAETIKITTEISNGEKTIFVHLP